MSYEKLYGRQFIDLGNGTYIPLILSGSSNCTMFYGNREIFERHWWSLGNSDNIAVTKEALMKWISKCTKDGTSDGEWFRQGDKWLTGKNMIKWVSSGIQSARTIEEICKALPCQSLQCFIRIYHSDKEWGEKDYCAEESRAWIKTTPALLDWIDSSKKRIESKAENESVYLVIEFSGIEPLGLGKKVADEKKPVICKLSKDGYLLKYERNTSGYSYSWTYDASEAQVFESAEDFEEKTAGMNFKHTLINANQPRKDYVIKLDDGYNKGMYVRQKTSRQLKLSYKTDCAKRFVSETAAQKYIKDMLNGRYSCKAFVVEKIEKEAEAS